MLMINEAILIGHVGRKETKSLKNGGDLTILSVATTTKFVDSTGEKQTRTTWHNIHCFSKLSEIANKYVHVGDLLYVRGEIHNKKIENGDRAGQYVYSVTANEIKFLPNGNKKSIESKPSKEIKIQNDEFEDSGIPF
jgi:single-strand DNA-binding protein